MLTVATYLDTNTGIEVYQEITGQGTRLRLMIFCPQHVKNMLASISNAAKWGHFLSSTCKAQRRAEHGALFPGSVAPCRPHVHTSGAAAGQRGRGAGRRRGPGHADARLPVRQVPGGPHPGAGRGGMVVSFTQRLSLEHHPQHHNTFKTLSPSEDMRDCCTCLPSLPFAFLAFQPCA